MTKIRRERKRSTIGRLIVGYRAPTKGRRKKALARGILKSRAGLRQYTAKAKYTLTGSRSRRARRRAGRSRHTG